MTKKLTYSILIILVGLMAIAGCIGTVTGSSQLATKDMDFHNFRRIEVGAAFGVNISRADSYKVSITANDNLFEYIEVTQQSDTLKIQLKPFISFSWVTLKADITLPELAGVNLSGATRGKVSGFSSTSKLEVEVSGASSIELDAMKAGETSFEISGASRASGNIDTTNAEFEVSGASTVEVKGSGGNIKIEASGVSRANLGDFKINNVSFNISGASSATVNTSGRLDGELSGASKLYYKGNPTLGKISTSGASSISQAE